MTFTIILPRTVPLAELDRLPFHLLRLYEVWTGSFFSNWTATSSYFTGAGGAVPFSDLAGRFLFQRRLAHGDRTSPS